MTASSFPASPGPRIELFTTGPACGLCETAWGHLRALHGEFRFESRKVQLEAGTPVPADYVIRAPVIHIDGVAAIEGRIDADALARALRRARVPPR